MLQNQISAKLDHKIPSKHIRIDCKNSSSSRRFSSDISKVIFGDINKIDSHRLKWSIVPYDIFNGRYYNMHKVTVHDQVDSHSSDGCIWAWNDYNVQLVTRLDRAAIDVYKERVIEIYSRDADSVMWAPEHAIKDAFNQMEQHKDDTEWLHQFYVDICNDYHCYDRERYVRFPGLNDKDSKSNVIQFKMRYPILWDEDIENNKTKSDNSASLFLGDKDDDTKTNNDSSIDWGWKNADIQSWSNNYCAKDGKSKIAQNNATINVKGFVKNMMEVLSHPINGNKYQSIIDKYNNNKDETYSFIMMKEKGKNHFDNISCYDENDEYDQKMSEIGECLTNVFIVKNIKHLFMNEDEEKVDSFSILIQVCQMDNFSFGTFESKISYPQKLYITNQTTVKDLMDKYVNNENYKLESCLLNGDELSMDDAISDKINNDKHASNKVLIKIIEENAKFTFNLNQFQVAMD